MESKQWARQTRWSQLYFSQPSQGLPVSAFLLLLLFFDCNNKLAPYKQVFSRKWEGICCCNAFNVVLRISWQILELSSLSTELISFSVYMYCVFFLMEAANTMFYSCLQTAFNMHSARQKTIVVPENHSDQDTGNFSLLLYFAITWFWHWGFCVWQLEQGLAMYIDEMLWPEKVTLAFSLSAESHKKVNATLCPWPQISHLIFTSQVLTTPFWTEHTTFNRSFMISF